MKTFSSSLPFIIFFLVIVMVVNMALGQKAAMWFLSLVALGMLVRNADKVSALMERASQKPTDPIPEKGNPITPEEMERAGDTILDWGTA